MDFLYFLVGLVLFSIPFTLLNTHIKSAKPSSKDDQPHNVSSINDITCLPRENNVSSQFIFIDVETANEHPNSICAIAIADLIQGKINAVKYYVKPPTDEFTFSDLHGITYDTVKDAETFDLVWAKHIAPYIGSKTLVAHYAHFDIRAIDFTLNYYNKSLDKLKLVSDTCILARRILPQLQNHKLNTVAEYFGIGLDHHDPLSDVMACANIFNLFLQTNYQLATSLLMPVYSAIDKQLYNSEFFSKEI